MVCVCDDRRLKLLDAKFNMYQLLNEEKELIEQKVRCWCVHFLTSSHPYILSVVGHGTM